MTRWKRAVSSRVCAHCMPPSAAPARRRARVLRHTHSLFNLAHLLYGDQLFYDLYDDPAFIHVLLEKATALYIAGTKLLKAWIDEPLDDGFHFSAALANGGVRACNDTVTLLAPATIAEFVMPYEQRALAAFGGGFVHYCGSNAALYAEELRNPYTRGLNFGNPERYDFGVVIPQLIDAGKCYMGTIARTAGESLEAYFRRVIGYTGGTPKALSCSPNSAATNPHTRNRYCLYGARCNSIC